MSRLGVLSVHLDGAPCAVGCPFCYLGAREADGRNGSQRLTRLRHPRAANDTHPAPELLRAVEQLDYAELAIALSEPTGPHRETVASLIDAARRRGLPTALTTTADVVLADASQLAGAARLNLSVDPWKMRGDVVEAVRVASRAAKAHVPEVIAIATLSTPAFAEQLLNGTLHQLVDLPELDGVALNALKPPPPFCDRAFWLDALSRLRPLLDRALDKRLHLDCYVAARLLGLGGCPGRADVTPAGGSTAKLAFRSCVYASRPDVEATADELAARPYAAPAVCPFDTRL